MGLRLIALGNPLGGDGWGWEGGVERGVMTVRERGEKGSGGGEGGECQSRSLPAAGIIMRCLTARGKTPF